MRRRAAVAMAVAGAMLVAACTDSVPVVPVLIEPMSFEVPMPSRVEPVSCRDVEQANPSWFRSLLSADGGIAVIINPDTGEVLIRCDI